MPLYFHEHALNFDTIKTAKVSDYTFLKFL